MSYRKRWLMKVLQEHPTMLAVKEDPKKKETKISWWLKKRSKFIEKETK